MFGFNDICAILYRIERKLDQMATTQAELDAYITGTLVPALTSLETTGQSVLTAVNALVAAYEAGAEDLTPQLTELQGVVAKLTSDQSQAASLATSLTGDLTPPAAATAAKNVPA